MTDHDRIVGEGPGSRDPGLSRSEGDLVRVLARIRERGAIGTTAIADGIAHADRYVGLLPESSCTIADLGSGGGLPGLVIAVRRPDVTMVLVERRHTRADLLRQAVAALQLAERVAVHGDDVQGLAAQRSGTFDVVTARSFAAPAVTARWAGRLLRPGGRLLVSDPPDSSADRWPPSVLDAAELIDEGVTEGIHRFRRQ